MSHSAEVLITLICPNRQQFIPGRASPCLHDCQSSLRAEDDGTAIVWATGVRQDDSHPK